MSDDDANSDLPSVFAPGLLQSFGSRLGVALKGESPFAFSKRSGIADSAIRKYLADKSEPGMSILAQLAKLTDTSMQWLATGDGPMRPGMSQNMSFGAIAPEGFVAVPKLDIRPSAGPGSLTIHHESEPDILAFREEWLRRIGVSPKFARLMVAKGDSMTDTIADGDLMIVDVSIREIVEEAIYVLVYGGLVKLKRIQMLRSGLLLLKSDNPRYETEEVPLAEQPELIIEGRVRWAGGMI